MRADAGAGMARQFFFFFFLSNWDGAPPRVGALRKRRTLRIGSGGSALSEEQIIYIIYENYSIQWLLLYS